MIVLLSYKTVQFTSWRFWEVYKNSAPLRTILRTGDTGGGVIPYKLCAGRVKIFSLLKSILVNEAIRWDRQEHILATQTSWERCNEMVWCPSGPGTPYELAYWRVVMQAAWRQVNKPGNKPASKIYAIKNPKARAALRCDQCSRPAEFAIYSSLSLYCEQCLPQHIS